jgi:hypothetical protein
MLSGKHVGGGFTINLHESRHLAGATYGAGVPSSVESAITGAAQLPVTSVNKEQQLDARRRTVIGHVYGRLKEEVQAMRDVADKPAHYQDIVALAGDATKAAPLITKLKTQINAGEDRILAQDLQGWAS